MRGGEGTGSRARGARTGLLDLHSLIGLDPLAVWLAGTGLLFDAKRANWAPHGEFPRQGVRNPLLTSVLAYRLPAVPRFLTGSGGYYVLVGLTVIACRVDRHGTRVAPDRKYRFERLPAEEHR